MLDQDFFIKISKSFNKDQVRSFRAKNAWNNYIENSGVDLINPNELATFTQQQELSYFKAFSYLKYRVHMAMNSHDKLFPHKAKDNLCSLLIRIRNRIASANIGLVGDCVKKSHSSYADKNSLFSDGQVALLSAVDLFDPWMGFRFSTYACNAIYNAFKRTYVKPMTLLDNFDTMYSLFKKSTEEDNETKDLRIEKLLSLLAKPEKCGLKEIEQEVLCRRFGLPVGTFTEGVPETLKQISHTKHLSQERIRQIELKGIKKLQGLLCKDNI